MLLGTLWSNFSNKYAKHTQSHNWIYLSVIILEMVWKDGPNIMWLASIVHIFIEFYLIWGTNQVPTSQTMLYAVFTS